MNKIKTSKSIIKRLKITSRGKFFRRRSSRSHLLQKKTSKNKQKLRKNTLVYMGDLINIKNKIPYIY